VPSGFPSLPLAFLNNMFGVDGLVVLIIGLLIFGRRLPEIGTNLQRTIREARGDVDTVTFAMFVCLAVIAICLLFYLAGHPFY
jgi:uncharacterized membrane protein YecN with MAPEG domain